ncbi:uroporphyrin-III C-methyltransferase/precorrin-2 dehydrogenase/sirohydrochlorin ferrochelatase [Catenulispora sp. MAP5-51]|jgi:uroporphyrin-III C-methyltransferase / precorrin-2 dehydrogenase / sirohydrochlorin ferrochelatase|uniref:uroporphyrinogen-III C-methyltransferase n=1 Tax=Catenulispora sp. MAP5-51 TaxID=3156298 RepID=UPI0035119F69
MSAMTDPASVYPAALRLAGRRVVVVGAGPVAQRRVLGLLDARADVLVVAPEATPAIEALADGGEIVWERRPYREGDLAQAWYAVAAADDPAVNAAVAREAEAGRVFCSRADSAEDSSAWTPAVGRHDGVTVSVIGGGDPRRAVDVRDGVLEGLRDGTLAAPHHRGRTAGVALIGGGPGDPDLITVRGRRLLAEADVVVADRLGPRGLLDELAPDVEIIDASKIPYGRALAQDAINEVLIERAKAGKFVVRLKGGDPFVFGRGFEEVLACAEAGVPCSVVPGITSSISVPALAGIPVTHRGVAHEFTVVSGHVAPDNPKSLVDWTALGRMTGTLVILMGIERIGAIAATLVAGGRDPQTPVAVIQEGTMPGERRVQTTLGLIEAAVAEAGIRPPAIVVVGPVVGLT